MKLLLFDIDGTLLLSGGAGIRAMNHAFAELYGLAEVLRGLNLAGRTDTSIFKEILEKNNFSYHPQSLQDFKTRYFSFLTIELQRASADQRLMPGVRELLAALHGRPDLHIGLLTGNWQKSGYLKLAHFGLERYFAIGAFSDDAEIRSELLPFAVTRFQEKYGVPLQPHEIYIVGDTPSDILCAKPHGAVSVAVAAAHYKQADLEPYQPDYLLADFTDLNETLRILG